MYYSISTRQNLGHKYYKSSVYNDKRTNSTEKELNKETKKDGAEYLRQSIPGEKKKKTCKRKITPIYKET